MIHNEETAMTTYAPPATFSELERRNVCDWLERHGVDPRDVDRHGEIAVDVAARTVEVVTLLRDKDGTPLVDGNEFVRARATVQLEAAPLPFPYEWWRA